MSGPTVSTRPARSYKAAADILSERDPALRRLVAQAGPVRMNPPTVTHFAALVRAILYQQLAGAAARAELGDPYRPYRSVVAWYCWRAAELYGGAAESALTS